MAAKESSVCPAMRFSRHCRSMTAICRRLFLLLKPLWINLAAISLRCAVNEESPACDHRMRRMFTHAISQAPLMQSTGFAGCLHNRTNRSTHRRRQASPCSDQLFQIRIILCNGKMPSWSICTAFCTTCFGNITIPRCFLRIFESSIAHFFICWETRGDANSRTCPTRMS